MLHLEYLKINNIQIRKPFKNLYFHIIHIVLMSLTFLFSEIICLFLIYFIFLKI